MSSKFTLLIRSPKLKNLRWKICKQTKLWYQFYQFFRVSAILRSSFEVKVGILTTLVTYKDVKYSKGKSCKGHNQKGKQFDGKTLEGADWVNHKLLAKMMVCCLSYANLAVVQQKHRIERQMKNDFSLLLFSILDCQKAFRSQRKVFIGYYKIVPENSLEST